MKRSNNWIQEGWKRTFFNQKKVEDVKIRISKQVFIEETMK